MKQRLMLQVLVVSLMLIWGASSASALGLGSYYERGWGDGEIDYDYYYDDDDNDNIDIDTDHRTRAIGFVLDTNVAKDSLFNYRLNIAFDKIEIDGLRPDSDYEADGFKMDHTFGFGVLRNEYVRLWVGPQINLSYYNEDNHYRPFNFDDDDLNMFGFGVGPAMGVNINVGPVVTFTITQGYKFTWLFGENFNDDFYGHESQYYINFGMLFRINDIYQQ
ncbi:MAG: hypothetical protein PF482_01860 [Desulfobacteraceae bacterium]|jgi:hypothetical protein|nr:hypothetical protein [Desulfobacteraceae bacterium]